MKMPENLDGLSGAVSVAVFLLAVAVIVRLFWWLIQFQKRRLEREWDESWASITELARAEGVPFTAPDSIRDIHNRIRWAREERLRRKIRKD